MFLRILYENILYIVRPAALSGSKALMTFSSLSSFIILLINSIGCLLVGVLEDDGWCFNDVGCF